MKPFSSFYTKLGGLRWRFRFVRSKDIPDDRWADCSTPDDPRRQIRIREVLRGKGRLETILHEALHAQWPDDSEEKITRHGKELSELLWKIGYRKVEDR